MTETTAPHPAVEPHRVYDYDMTPLGDWGDWQAIWDHPQIAAQIRLGLLHTAFDIRIMDKQTAGERLCLILELADGYDHRNFYDPTDTNSRSHEREEQRSKLVEKAMAVLVSHYFRDPKEQGDAHDDTAKWVYLIELPGVLEKTIWFFRANQHCTVSNLPRGTNTHLSRVVRSFASRLWKLGWNYDQFKTDSKNRPRRLYEQELAFQASLKAARPQLLLLAFHLGEEDLLIANSGYELDYECQEHLLGVAMRSNYFGGKQVIPDSLEQAFFMGSSAARVLILKHIADLERDRLQAIRLAERIAGENEARLAKLRQGPAAGSAIRRVLHQSDDSS